MARSLGMGNLCGSAPVLSILAGDGNGTGNDDSGRTRTGAHAKASAYPVVDGNGSKTRLPGRGGLVSADGIEHVVVIGRAIATVEPQLRLCIFESTSARIGPHA